MKHNFLMIYLPHDAIEYNRHRLRDPDFDPEDAHILNNCFLYRFLPILITSSVIKSVE